MKFQNQFNRHEFPRYYETNNEPSQTIPDQAMPISEILRRFASGLPISGARVALYEGEVDIMPDMSHMDLAEREEIMRGVQDEIKTLQDRAKQDSQTRQKKREEQALNALIAKKIAEKDYENSKKVTNIT